MMSIKIDLNEETSRIVDDIITDVKSSSLKEILLLAKFEIAAGELAVVESFSAYEVAKDNRDKSYQTLVDKIKAMI